MKKITKPFFKPKNTSISRSDLGLPTTLEAIKSLTSFKITKKVKEEFSKPDYIYLVLGCVLIGAVYAFIIFVLLISQVGWAHAVRAHAERTEFSAMVARNTATA